MAEPSVAARAWGPELDTVPGLAHTCTGPWQPKQNEGLLEKFLLQMTLKLFMQYPHAFCGYRYHYFIMLSCEV